MASTIKVDNVQNQPGTNIVSKCGTDVTLGASGDTVALACGASQTGFGRTGTVDWQTGSIKTAGFTPTNGEGYFCNTTGGIFTVTLPAGVAGNIVAFADYTRTFNTNNLTITPNGSEKIGGGGAGDSATLDVNGQSATFVYVDGTEGWINIQETQTSQIGTNELFVTATGGSPCTGAIVCTNYKVHTFTGPGTFCVSCAGNACGSNTVDYLVVAGGGGGASSDGAGGGGGGYRIAASTAACSPAYSAPPLANPAGAPVTATPYSITVGAGGGGSSASPPTVSGNKGSDSIFHTITSTGGGYGSTSNPPSPGLGGPGGSGGGSGNNPTGGAGNDPPVSPSQGFPGGSGPGLGSGGGGATAAGAPGASSGGTGNAGGAGDANDIDSSGSPVTYSRGGNGDTAPGPAYNTPEPNNSGNGSYGSCAGSHATGNGGSGIVIIRYKFQ